MPFHYVDMETIDDPPASTWTAVGLADYVTIPSGGVTGVVLEIYAPQSATVGVRKFGSSDTKTGSTANASGAHYACWVGVDANNKFEIYTSSTSAYFVIYGYFTAGFAFFDNAVAVGMPTTGGWTDAAVPTGVPANATGIIYWGRIAENQNFGLRKNGSAAAVYSYGNGTLYATVVMECDASQVVEYYNASSSNWLFAIGYTTSDSGITYVDFTDKTPTVGDWYDLAALPTGAAYGIFEVAKGYGKFGIRESGDASLGLSNLGVNGITSIVQPCDDSFKCEGKIMGAATVIYLIGWMPEAAAIGGGCSGVSIGDCMIM